MRRVREASKADVYHVVVRGTGRQLIFEDDVDRRRFLAILANALKERDGELYAWCLMGNHVHLLVHMPLDDLAACIGQVCGTYARYFNNRGDRVGHLFQGRYLSEAINDDAYLLTAVRYIHNNPVKAGLARVDSYPWSSYGEYVGKPRMCETSLVLDMLEGLDGFVAFHLVEASSDQCLDVDASRGSTTAMPDTLAIKIAEDCLKGTRIADVKALPKPIRNAALMRMKESGLTVRQIERLTGIGRNIVARAK